MDKKKYEKPIIEINLVDDKDVITTSGILEWDENKNDGIDFGSKFGFTISF